MKGIKYFLLVMISISTLWVVNSAYRHSVKFHPEDENHLMSAFNRIKEQYNHIDYFNYRIPLSDLISMKKLQPEDIDKSLAARKYQLYTHELTKDGSDYYEWSRYDTVPGSNPVHVLEMGVVQYTKTIKGYVNVLFKIEGDSYYYPEQVPKLKELGFEEKEPKNTYESYTQFFTNKTGEMVLIERLHNKIEPHYSFLVLDVAEMLE